MELPPRVAALVARNGLTLAALAPGDRDLVLALAASRLEPRRAWREDEINRALIAWLEAGGSMLRIDHVELRRWLVDAGFVARDGYGRAYVRGPRELERARALVGSGDGAALEAAVLATRAGAERERAARRRAFESGASAPRPERAATDATSTREKGSGIPG